MKLFYVVRVNFDPTDTHAAERLDEAVTLSLAGTEDKIEYGSVEAEDAGAARLMIHHIDWMFMRADRLASILEEA